MKGSTVLFRMVSIRHLLHRRLRSAITLVGVAGGVTLLLSVTLINATLHSSIQTSAQNVAGNAQIEVSATDQAGLPDKDVAVINSVSGVDQAIPVIRETSRLLGPKAEVRTLIVGVTPSLPTLFSGTTRTGSIVIDGGFGRDGNGILLSLSVARVLHVVPGDAIRIRTPNGDVQGHVTGTLSGNALTGVNGGSLGIMQLSAAQTMFARPGRVDSIYLRTRAGASVEGIKAAIRRRLKGAGLVGAPGDRTRGFEQTFAALASLGSLAGIVSLFVALFVVYNSMSMSFAERRRETSMAMALGAGRRQVFRALLAEAALLGTLASFGGAVAGIVLAKLLVGRALAAYRVFPITAGGSVHIDPVLILIAVAGGITVSMLGAYVPAKGVTRVAPIESLRPSAPYENLSSPRQFPARSAKLVAICALFIGIAGTLVTARRDHIPTGLMSLFVLALLCGITLLLPSIVSVATRAIRPLMMRFGTLGRLAADGQERNPGRTVLTVGALLVTSALVIGVGAALGSYNHRFSTLAYDWFGAPLYVQADSYTGFTSDQPLPGSLSQHLIAIQGISHAYPMRYSVVDLGGKQVVIYAWPIAQAAQAGVTRTLSATGGNQDVLISALGRGEIVVSRYLAQQRHVTVGDTLILPTPTGTHAFSIADVFDDLSPIDSIFMEYNTYSKLWSDTKADRFAIFFQPGMDSHRTSQKLQLALDRARIPARILTRDQMVNELLGTVRGLASLAQAIQFAALLVAALAVANTMFAAVLERRWEMGLQRTLGMAAAQLRRTILLESGAIGFLGGAGGILAGFMLGFLFTRVMQAGFAWRIPFIVRPSLAGGGIIGTVAIAGLSGLYPSRLAARGEIVRALRYE